MIAPGPCLPIAVFVAGALVATILLCYCAFEPARQELEDAKRRCRKLEGDVVALNVELATARTEAACALRRARELQSNVAEARANLTWALARTSDAERELFRASATIDHLKHAVLGRARARPGPAAALGRAVRVCE